MEQTNFEQNKVTTPASDKVAEGASVLKHLLTANVLSDCECSSHGSAGHEGLEHGRPQKRGHILVHFGFALV